MRLILSFMMILGLICPSTLLASASQIRTSSEPLTTEIRMITPFTHHGINSKLRITNETTGSCWASSHANSARPNTWRCKADNVVYDPCFKNPVKDHQSVICLKSPWDKNAVLVKLESPLPYDVKSTQFNTNKSIPWALELINGKYCTFTTTPTGEIAGQPITYRCDAGSYVIGEIERSTQNWFVLYHGNDSLYMKQVRVKAAWY